jgi:hypothetical protein
VRAILCSLYDVLVVQHSYTILIHSYTHTLIHLQAAGQGIAKSRLVGNLVGQDAAAITQAQEQVR